MSALAETVAVGMIVEINVKNVFNGEVENIAARPLVDVVTEVVPVLVQTRPAQHVAFNSGVRGPIGKPPTLMVKLVGTSQGTLTAAQVAWRASRAAPWAMPLEAAAASTKVARVVNCI